MEQKRFSVAELANETNMSVAFWRTRILRREIEFEKFGRSVRITREALERYLQSRRAVAQYG